MRDQLAHRYFDASHSIVAQTVSNELGDLAGAVQALLQVLGGEDLPG